MPRERILFVAFAGWDAAGAKLFGYPTFWVNRLGLPPERFGPMPDITSSDLERPARFRRLSLPIPAAVGRGP